MFVISNEKTKVPIIIWLPEDAMPEESCMAQAYHLANLPFIHKWVSLMPDTHTGMGMPIGGVIASDEVVIPNAVGTDIGCGMGFVSTNIRIDDIKDIPTPNGSIIQGIVGDILRNIPVGFGRHKQPQPSNCLDRAIEQLDQYEDNTELLPEIKEGYLQIGTLGGGNHFIEIQEDSNGYIGIMLHSGSRHFGNEICNYFNRKAKALNKKWYSSIPAEYRLAFLPMDSKEGRQYLSWMNLALDFAYENRSMILLVAKAIFAKWIEKYTDLSIEYGDEINCHHNYAAMEHHYGKNVLVHRKGATRAREGEIALIPGAMGSYSYVVRGKGNPESFCSSSHGAGRRYSRTSAMHTFSCEEVMADLNKQGVVLGKHNKNNVAEESRFAYKDIDQVMANQADLVEPVKRLKTIGVVKG
jgi:tRNA-splicing ligase RtcB (3'-phosphate/5'-hydroxy nucleic acid ligase)